MRIERFRWWHIAEVLLLEEELFGEEKWSSAMFWNELAQHNFYIVATGRAATGRAATGRVATEEDEVLGYAGLASTQDEAWVQNIAVKRTAQRRGIGRELLEALLAEAARLGIKQTLLEVAVDNAAAQHLYATYDFEPVGIRRGYYQPSNTDALVMMRNA